VSFTSKPLASPSCLESFEPTDSRTGGGDNGNAVGDIDGCNVVDNESNDADDDE